MDITYYRPVSPSDTRGPWTDAFPDSVVRLENTDGTRTSIPVFACSPAFGSYTLLRDALLAVRDAVGHGYYCEAEDPILARMTELYCELTEAELAYIKAQGSWKFAAFCTEDT